MAAVTHAQHFARLDRALYDYAWLWRPRPFTTPALPWQAEHSELTNALLALDDATVAALDDDVHALAAWLAGYVPELAQLPELIRVPAFRPSHVAPRTPTGFEWGVDGRKWQQVVAFVDALEANSPDTAAATGDMLDWCAGKAHLGRYLAWRTGRTVRAVERDSGLVERANRLAAARALPVTAICCDVLSDEVVTHLDATSDVVALHACGRLHLQLLRVATATGLRRIALAPCCYHLSDVDDSLLSDAARSSALALSPSESQLAVQETVTSGRSRQRQRERESAWRLGFDAWQREARGVDSYLPVPSAPRAQLRGNFAGFMAWAVARKGLPQPPPNRLAAFEALGARRHAEVTRLALPRHLFRRVLELWLVLDRACYLEQAGYRVAVGEFCERQQTPRNLLIDALR